MTKRALRCNSVLLPLEKRNVKFEKLNQNYYLPISRVRARIPGVFMFLLSQVSQGFE